VDVNEDKNNQIISASSRKYSGKMTKKSLSDGDKIEDKNKISRKEGDKDKDEVTIKRRIQR
jgi:hypothetical protein